MNLKTALMRKNGLTSSEADEEIQDAREELLEIIEDEPLDELYEWLCRFFNIDSGTI